MTPQKCNADVCTPYPSRHCTSPSVCNSPDTRKPKGTTPDHHNLAHPLRTQLPIRLDASPVTPRKCKASIPNPNPNPNPKSAYRQYADEVSPISNKLSTHLSYCPISQLTVSIPSLKHNNYTVCLYSFTKCFVDLIRSQSIDTYRQYADEVSPITNMLSTHLSYCPISQLAVSIPSLSAVI